MKTSEPKGYYSLRSFASYLGRYKLRFVTVWLSFVVANALITIVPLFIGRLIGTLATQPINNHSVTVYIIILIICSTGHDVMWHVSEFLYLKLFNPLAFRYETIIFQQVINRPYPYFVDKFSGKISSYITSIGLEFREQLEHVFWDYTEHFVSLFTVCAILIALNWQTGLSFMASLLLMFLVGRRTVRNSIKYEKVWTDIQSTKNGKIIDAVANFVNVKSFQKEALETATIQGEQAKTIKAANRSFLWAMLFWGSMGFVVRNILWPSTIILNVYLYTHHEISLADLTTFLTAVVLFTNYVWDIIWSISQFTLKLARLEEAHAYLFGQTNIIQQYFDQQTRLSNKPEFKQRLDLHDLNFCYDNADEPVLQDLNLELKKGERLGIVGRSGGGKTTLTKLLLGYYQVPDGQIQLDDVSTDTRDLATLISYVPQDTSLFHRSIADNIAYATDRTVSLADIIQAAKQAHADEFITQIKEGYDALVGERGVKLSAGQRQRIAIARAFLDNKPILILDEATSALDSESELLVQRALEALWQDKTVIAIAHRLSTLRNMDRIIVIDQGKIIEQGNHQELLRKDGAYAKLWAHQSGGFMEEEA